MDQVQVSEELWHHLLASMRELVNFHEGEDDSDLPALQKAREVLRQAEQV